jgi:hypothetical protein
VNLKLLLEKVKCLKEKRREGTEVRNQRASGPKKEVRMAMSMWDFKSDLGDNDLYSEGDSKPLGFPSKGVLADGGFEITTWLPCDKCSGMGSAWMWETAGKPEHPPKNWVLGV